MISALLSDFDRLTPAQRQRVDHWIINDPERFPLLTAQAELEFDIDKDKRGDAQ